MKLRPTAVIQQRKMAPQPFKRSRAPKGERFAARFVRRADCNSSSTVALAGRRGPSVSRTANAERSASVVGVVSCVSSDDSDDSDSADSSAANIGNNVTAGPARCPAINKPAITTSAGRRSIRRSASIVCCVRANIASSVSVLCVPAGGTSSAAILDAVPQSRQHSNRSQKPGNMSFFSSRMNKIVLPVHVRTPLFRPPWRPTLVAISPCDQLAVINGQT
jgi:hypothetical protein